MKSITLSLITAFILTTHFYVGQSTKIKFKSKQSKGVILNNKKLLILWDNVVFTNNKSKMYCDSANYNRTDNSFIAYKNIKIIENDSLELFGDSLHYFGNEQKALIYGNVKVINPEIELETPSLIFNQKDKIAYYSQTGKIKHKKEGYVIVSQKGTFLTRINKLFFKENVTLDHENYKISSDTLIYNTKKENTEIIGSTKIITKNSIINCEKGWFDNKYNQSSLKGDIYIQSDNHTLYADSIFYDEFSGISYAEGNVKIVEDSNNVIIQGKYGIHNENNDSTIIYKNSILTQSDSTDTLIIYADQFLKVSDSIKSDIFCYNNVIIDGTQIQGDCDSIYFNENDSVMKCIEQPILWIDSNQISGDIINFKIHDGIIYEMDIKNNSMIINQKDSIHYDQIKGNFIKGFFDKNKMWLLKVKGDGKVIYYSIDDNDSIVTDLNDITCEKMDIYIDDNQISSINFQSNPKGKTQPLQPNDKGKFIDDFFIFPKRTYEEKYNEAKGDLPKGK